MRTAPTLLALALAASLSGAVLAADGTTTTTTTESSAVATTDSLTTRRGSATVSGKISSTFSSWAGSTENAESLVNGLRTGSAITLTSPAPGGSTTPGSATFTPATKPMGYGNVYLALGVAQKSLAAQGITQPTPEQLQAALNGGTVTAPDGTTVRMSGVLAMRADGMGWGKIANTLGFKLGPVVSGLRTTNSAIARQGVTAPSGVSTTGGTTAAGGMTTGSGRGNAYGHGIVTGTGAAPSGITTGAGIAGMHPNQGMGSGIVTGGGQGAGQGMGQGGGNGHGKGPR